MHTTEQLMEAVSRLETIVLGDPAREIKGLVERVNTQEAYMGEIRGDLKKILWALILGVFAAGLNLLLSTGKLSPHNLTPPAAVQPK